MYNYLTNSLLCQWYPVHHPLCLCFLHRGESFLQLRVNSLFFRLFSHHESAVALIRVEVKKKTGEDEIYKPVAYFHWRYLRCILTIAWNCSGSVNLIFFPTSMAATMVRWRFTTSENNIGIVLAQSSYKRIGCNVWQEIYTWAQNQVFLQLQFLISRMPLILFLTRIGFPSSLWSSSAHRGSLTVA